MRYIVKSAVKSFALLLIITLGLTITTMLTHDGPTTTNKFAYCFGQSFVWATVIWLVYLGVRSRFLTK